MDDPRRESDELTAGYLEGDLSPDQRARLKALLETDAAFRSRFLHELQLHEAIKVVSREEPPGASRGRTEFVEEILAQWSKSAAPARKTRRHAAAPPGRWKPLLIAAAVLVGVGIALLLIPTRREPPSRTSVTLAPKEAPPSERDGREARERELEIERERQQAVARETKVPPLPSPPPPPKPPEEKPAVSRVEPPAPPAPKPPEPPPALPVQEPKRETRVAVATLRHLRGEAVVLGESGERPAQAGQQILAGEGLKTLGARSLAIFEYPDQTQVELGSDTVVARIHDREAAAAGKPGPGKRLVMERGVVSADVARQPADQPMIVATPHAEVRVLGTALLVGVDLGGAGSTLLEVDEGRVRFTRSRDGLAIDVSSGFYAVAAAGVELSPRPLGQDPRRKPAQGPPKVDPVRVDGAIKKGLAFLRAEQPKTVYAGADRPQCADELVLWTLIHGGATENDPDLQRLLKSMLEGELKYTYRVALQAMILEQLDRVKHQGRIQQCAQFLVDNQINIGNWSYGEPSIFVKDLPPTKDVATGGKPRPKSEAAMPVHLRTKPRVLRKLPVVKRRDGTGGGDNSNTQYAALGLRACHDAGILIPKDVIEAAQKWWRGPQYKDAEKKREPGGGKGWAYGYDQMDWTGSMTAGAVGSLVIYDYIQGQDWKKDGLVHEGLQWLGGQFTVAFNPGAQQLGATHFYYLYSMERAGILYGTELLGKHEWYPDGAKMLLDAQKPDGSWKAPGGENATTDTCFAILFLRRATAPLVDVASVDRFMKK